MLVARDYQNNEYPLIATKIHTSELNGQDNLELKIPQQKNNSLDLLSIDKLWEFDYNNIIYKAVNIKQQTRGNSFNLNVRAMPLFYWDFSKSIIHENHDGSHTANSAFRTVFEGSGYNFVLVDFSPSVEIEGFGKGASRLELFKRILDRYNYEFIIQGSTVYMHHRIGNDTNYMYRYKLNASNVSSTTDASEYFVHIKGFGDFEDGEEDYFNNAKLKREYTHPIADVVTRPGEQYAEGSPIVDGRITQTSTLDGAMSQAVEDSLQVTVEGTLHDVRKMGYDHAVPVKGDRVWMHDERIDLKQEIRLHKIVTTYDEKDDVIDCNVTFGSQSIGERHKANINSLSKRFRDLLTGHLKLPVISLEKIGMDMINAIHAASSEIIFGDFGMMAISKTNPNHVFGANSEGWYISQDGGRTPRTIATAQGIYADALFAGTLWLTNELNIESLDGFLNITGSRFMMKDKDGNSSTLIEPGNATFSYGAFHLINSDGSSKTEEWDSAEGNAKLHADRVAESAEDNAKGHADAVAGTAEGNAKDHADGVGANLRDDLQMTSPLPNDLELSRNGITAYNNSNNRYARLDYRGLFINRGAIQIRGFDGREFIADGVMRGSRVANIQPFKTNGYHGQYGDSPIIFDGMNWRFPGTMGYEEVHRVDDEYKGRYIDFRCSVGIADYSGANSTSIQIRFRNWDNEIVGSGTYSVSKGTSPLRQVTVRVDLQSMFGHVPNYRTVVLYAQVRVSGNTNVEGIFRLNRGEFIG